MPQVSAGQALSMIRSQYGKVPSTAPDTYSVAAVAVAPIDATGAGLVEPVDDAYTRLTLANDSATFTAIDGGVQVAPSLTWPQAQSTWGNVLGLAFFDGPTFVSYFEFTRPRLIQQGDTLRLPTGSVQLFAGVAATNTITEEQITVPQVLTASDGSRYLVKAALDGTVLLQATDLYGPPTAPGGLIHTAPNTLAWTAPEHDGGSPVTSYTLWWQESGTQNFIVLPGDAVTTVMPDNPDPASYWVTADNMVGISDPSNILALGAIAGG